MTLCTAILACLTLWHGPPADDGLIRVSSNAGAAETVARVRPALASRGLRRFVAVDHAANARSVGQGLRTSTVFVFGNPSVGTRTMQCAPSSAIDLPLKLLVWEEQDGSVWVGVNDPVWLAHRHHAGDCGGAVPAMERGLRARAAEVAGSEG